MVEQQEADCNTESNQTDIDGIDTCSFENAIERSLERQCFIESISLIHNTIEFYLGVRIKTFLFEKARGNPEGIKRFQLLKEEFENQYLKYLNTVSYALGIIDENIYESISSFNERRNVAIHKLPARPQSIEQLRSIARNGREIQLKLSPVNHSDQSIKNIMEHFDKITKREIKLSFDA